MNATDHRRINYSHLETDEEFRARLGKRISGAGMYAGDKLDDWAWSVVQMQRRIVWAHGVDP